MPIVYGVNASPFVRKVRAFLAEKGIAYELEPVIPGMQPPDYKKISPLGKVPAFRDGDRTLADSSIICAYLERTHPQPALYPADPYEYARALWFEEYGDSALSAVLTAKLFFQRFVSPRLLNRPSDETVVKKALDEEIPPLFDYLESQIEGKEVLVGNHLSIGDLGVATHFVSMRHAGLGVDAKRWPELARYVKQIHGRPSFKALIEEEDASYGKTA